MLVEPCTCDGIEVLGCTKLCSNSPEYEAMAGEAEYASWRPICMDPQRRRELGLPDGTLGVTGGRGETFPQQPPMPQSDRMDGQGEQR
jgi:hypothetical protein